MTGAVTIDSFAAIPSAQAAIAASRQPHAARIVRGADRAYSVTR